MISYRNHNFNYLDCSRNIYMIHFFVFLVLLFSAFFLHHFFFTIFFSVFFCFRNRKLLTEFTNYCKVRDSRKILLKKQKQIQNQKTQKILHNLSCNVRTVLNSKMDNSDIDSLDYNIRNRIFFSIVCGQISIFQHLSF